MSRRTRSLLLIAGACVLAVLVARVGPATIAALLRRVGWNFALVSVLYASYVTVRATALWRCLPARSLGFLQVLRIRFAGEAVEMLTFTGPFLAEPTKGWLLSRRGAPPVEGFGAVATEYLLYVLSSSWMAAGAITILLVRDVLPKALHDAVAIVLAVLAAFSAAFVSAAITGVGLIVPSLQAIVGAASRARAVGLAARLRPIEQVILEFIHARPARLAEVLLIEAAAQGLLVAEAATIMRALELRFPWLDPFMVEGGVKFIGVAFFFVPGQIGASEGVYTVLFQALGFTAAAGLTMALVRRMRAMAVAALGTLALSLTSY